MIKEGICIFGGSFDPVHKGHKKLASFVCKKLSLRKMLIVPAALSPFKNSSGASAEDRMKMCSLAFYEDEFIISDVEIRRGGKSYTVDTVKAVKEMFPDEKLYLLIGSDQLLHFDKWYRFDEILSFVALVAVSREDSALKTELENFADEKIRMYGECIILDFEPIVVSSTEIRNSISKDENTAMYVDENVTAYIRQKGLYTDV